MKKNYLIFWNPFDPMDQKDKDKAPGIKNRTWQSTECYSDMVLNRGLCYCISFKEG